MRRRESEGVESMDERTMMVKVIVKKEKRKKIGIKLKIKSPQ
jgi:hypothetical protein